ncbi:MAG TPA: c-type cytochrome domain-containing protein, partial [Methylomirabilota bacterium]|nr:c-type cytochrome domain-containing protein [Methylomirabilota bacterium]
MKSTALIPILLLLLVAPLRGAAADAERHFTDIVKPLLDSRCISCHGPDKVKGALRLDSREAILKGGDNGPSIVPGKPSESLLLKAVMHTAPDLEMPPKEKLTPKDIAAFEKWIQDGAPWVQTTNKPS